MKHLYLIFLSFLCFLLNSSAQTEITIPNIPHLRQLIHDKIDEDQETILGLDGKKDRVFSPTKDIDINLQLTNLLKVRINNLQANIELDSTIDDNSKYKWLRGVHDVLQSFISNYQLKLIKGVFLGDLIVAYEKAAKLEMMHQPFIGVIEENDLEVGNILVANFALQQNQSLQASKNLLVLKTCERYPNKILQIISNHLDVPFADSLLAIEAHKDPEKIYNYASASNALSKKIKQVKEPLVKAITQMASIPSGRIYFPFLDDIYHHKITIDSIASIKNNDEAYYRLLVKTEINYVYRMQFGDTPYAKKVLTDNLQRKAVEVYIDEINALHDEKIDAIRFKKLDNLTPEELYYLCVLGEEEIYTSSYIGVYNRIFLRMKTPNADTLLKAVHHDFYRKFIRMAAAYNVLDDFLKRMDKPIAEELMKNFVAGLDKTITLEDAVDVADSYASIENESIKQLMLNQIKNELAVNKASQNRRGIVMYELLQAIFLSNNSSNTNNTAPNTLGITPVYSMPIDSLKDSSGKIIIQQFFYGDKDGKNVFNSFLANFRNANWRITEKQDWAEVKSIKGTPIIIYANKALDERKDLDAKAQENLNNYLDSMNIKPTIVIHRGHSYYVKSTIKQLAPSAKIVLLGSCGGYHSLDDVLSICPEAHIIASKQVGTGVINITLINAITETLRQGKSLDWPNIWKSLDYRFTGAYKEKFDDYVPPYKNLGAIFIMAYNKSFAQND